MTGIHPKAASRTHCGQRSEIAGHRVMGMYDFRIAIREVSPHRRQAVEIQSAALSQRRDANACLFEFRSQQARAIDANHLDIMPSCGETLAQLDHDSFESAALERLYDVGDTHAAKSARSVEHGYRHAKLSGRRAGDVFDDVDFDDNLVPDSVRHGFAKRIQLLG
jgi:hypothetical protein